MTSPGRSSTAHWRLWLSAERDRPPDRYGTTTTGNRRGAHDLGRAGPEEDLRQQVCGGGPRARRRVPGGSPCHDDALSSASSPTWHPWPAPSPLRPGRSRRPPGARRLRPGRPRPDDATVPRGPGPTDRGRIHRGSVEGDGHQPQRGTGATTDVRHPLEQVPRGVVVAEPDGDPGEPGTRLRGIPSGAIATGTGEECRRRSSCCHGNPAGSPVGARADDDHVRVEGLDLPTARPGPIGRSPSSRRSAPRRRHPMGSAPPRRWPHPGPAPTP